MAQPDFSVGIGGAAGQGVATPGTLLAKLFVRRGLHINAYNAYQSIIRGGHTFLTIRTGEAPVRCMGDELDMLIPLNQDTMDRHVRRMRPGSAVLFDGGKVNPEGAADGVQLCPLPLAQLAKSPLHYNTAAVAAVLRLVGVECRPFEEMLAEQFERKGDAVVAANVAVARAGCRALCAAAGGGFALVTEALGAAAMMEIPVVCINVQRAGPATGVPTKTEQGDLWQVLGAGQGDYPRIIV